MKTKGRILLCAIVSTICCGCSSTPRVPVDLQYSPPSAGADVATIKGSQRPSVFFDNFTVYVFAIDGKRVMAGNKAWSTPIAVTAGRHTVAVEFQRGSHSARTEIEFQAVRSANYEVRFDTDIQVYGRNSYVDFWIVNLATGKSVTGIKRAAPGLSGNTSTVIPIPIIVPSS